MARKPEHGMTDSEAGERLARELPAWSVEDRHIVRRYRTGGWKSTLMVANAIGHLAEAAWHHPELHLSYGEVEVRLSTHFAGSITGKDLALAERIEAIVMWRPGEEPGPLDGTPEEPRHRHVRYEG